MQNILNLRVLECFFLQSLKIKVKQVSLAKKSYAFKYKPQDAGFSMVEMIAVVMMVAILAAIALPSWSAFVTRQRVNKANDAVLAAIQEAQQLAKEKKLTYSVSFKTDSNIPQFAVYEGTTPANWRNLGEDLAIKSRQIVVGTNLSNVNTVSSSVSYSSNFNSSAPQTISFNYIGVLAPKTNGNSPDTGLKVVIAAPQSGTIGNGGMKRCVIVSTILGSTRTARDTDCN